MAKAKTKANSQKKIDKKQDKRISDVESFTLEESFRNDRQQKALDKMSKKDSTQDKILEAHKDAIQGQNDVISSTLDNVADAAATADVAKDKADKANAVNKAQQKDIDNLKSGVEKLVKANALKEKAQDARLDVAADMNSAQNKDILKNKKAIEANRRADEAFKADKDVKDWQQDQKIKSLHAESDRRDKYLAGGVDYAQEVNRKQASDIEYLTYKVGKTEKDLRKAKKSIPGSAILASAVVTILLHILLNYFGF